MKFQFTFFNIVFFASFIYGQHSNLDLCGIYKHSLKTKNLDTITQILERDTFQINNHEKAELFSMRGRLQLIFNRLDINKNLPADNPILVSAHSDYTMAIDLAKADNDELRYVWRRHLDLKFVKSRYKGYESDLEFLTSNGYRKDKFDSALTALSRYDGEFWLGTEFSFFSGYGPPYTIRNESREIIAKRKFSFSTSALIFGYSRNLESSMNDFNFTLLRLEAPIFVDITQFGFINALESNHWYYRPEVGIGYSIFQLSLGYTVFFKSHKARSLSNTFVSYRAKYTF